MILDGLPLWGGLAWAAPRAADLVVAGIPYDGSAVYRRGAAQAPAEIRRISAAIPPVTESGTALVELRLHDMGDLNIGESIATGWRAAADHLAEIPPDTLLTVIGGDHTAAIPVLAAQVRRHPELRVLWVDAHPDLCDFSRGGAWTCGCALRRALEVSGIDPARVVLAGCRDFDLEELDFIGAKGMTMLPIGQVGADPRGSGEIIAEALGSGPVHVSFDIDVLDPAFAPGTEIASAGGLSTRQALDLLTSVAARSRLVGLDVMEVSPPLDHSDITSLAALKLIFEFWGMAWKPRT
jgi:agmatinase